MSPVSWKIYRNLFLATVLIAMMLVAMINFVADPGEIYLQKYLKERYVTKFADTLIKQKVGMIEFGNERLVKDALAKRAGRFDCVIMGSSQVMQMGVQRQPATLSHICKSSINLGVSGGSLEDVLAFTYDIMNSVQKPRKIIIGMHPWTLKMGQDGRAEVFKEKYEAMLEELRQSELAGSDSYNQKLLKNILNRQYFVESVKKIGEGKVSLKFFNDGGFESFKTIDAVDYEVGYKEPLILADGSLLSSKEELAGSKDISGQVEGMIAGDDFVYGIRGYPFNERAEWLFSKLIQYLKGHGIEVILIMPPYHEVIFTHPKYRHQAAFLSIVQERVKALAQKNQVKVFGGFNPQEIGCQSGDFLNYYHPSTRCFNKINFN